MPGFCDRGGTEASEEIADREFFIKDEANKENFCDNAIVTSLYTKYDFLPRNLAYQLKKTANAYFTIMALIQLIPGLSPVTPASSILPLLFVLTATAMKEAWEDYARHKSDADINSTLCTRVTDDGETEAVPWFAIAVGDVVFMENDEQVPCDLMVLTTSEENGVAFIETANLDGETNLKIKNSLEATRKFVKTAKDASAVRAKIVCETPNDRLYSFDGNVEFSNVGGKKGHKSKFVDKRLPVGPDEILLRGCKLRNTRSLYGVAINTGHDTKLMMNASIKKDLKRSQVDLLMNQYLKMILCFEFVVVLICAILGALWWENNGKAYPYMGIESDSNSALVGFTLFWTFLILYSALIPISLYVSVEMVKVSHAGMMNVDEEMYYAEADKPARARTSNLSEELGQVEYVFSDKTGTLTCNKMEFLKCSIAGFKYGLGTSEAQRAAELRVQGKDATLTPHASVTEVKEQSSDDMSDDYDPRLFADMEDGENAGQIDMFMTILAVCHSVIPEEDPEAKYGYRWQAASPDEGALVEAAARFGYVFHTRNPGTVVIDTPEEIGVEYEILNVLEFNSDRKRMSVVVRTPDDRILLLTKGADAVIFRRMASCDFKEISSEHLSEFAVEGLRTLCLAVRELDEDEYEEWAEDYNEAALSTKKRAEKLDTIAERLEVDLELVGCTAIEDKLQDGVPNTIATLAKGGLKIWVLTGDKQETAINIGFACALLTHNMNLIVINATDLEETQDKLNAAVEEFTDIKSEGLRNALVMDGMTLAFCLASEANQDLLFRLGQACAAVIFCRVSPKQKADVVLLVRNRTDAVTLAIGDGANDVSMIKEAHVGIGISGQEGMQAALASDYAVGQFRYLLRLLLVHGRWSYKRISKLILYSFYKNFAFNLTQLWFNIFAGFSGQTLLDDWYIAIFNLAFTALPIMVIAVFDQDVSDRASEMFPQLYRSGPICEHFNRRRFLAWLVDGLYQSLVIFFVPYLWFYHGSTHTSGRMDGLHHFGSVVYCALVITVNVKIVLITESWTWLNHLATWSHMFGWFLFAVLYHALFEQAFSIYDQLDCPSFWLVLVAVPAVSLLPSFLYENGMAVFRPSLIDYVKAYAIPWSRDVHLTKLPHGEAAIEALVSLGNMQAFQKEVDDAEYSEKKIFRNVQIYTLEGGKTKKTKGSVFKGFGHADSSHGRQDKDDMIKDY